MRDAEVIRRSRAIVEEAGVRLSPIETSNFLDYSNTVRDIVKEWPREKISLTPWVKDFAESLRRLRDDFERRVKSDPMILYSPQHSTSLDFHRSLAETRYFRSGNRCSKTQSGVAEVYWTLTYQHPYRPRAGIPAQVLLVGINFSKYRVHTFEPKYISGEGGNPLSPVFPEGGKWFHSYDQKSYCLELCCPDCAEKGTPGRCTHQKSRLILFSDQEGPKVMAGCQAALVQLDEQIGLPIYREAVERTKTVPNSGIIVTETPVLGEAFWTHTVLTASATRGDMVPNSNRPVVSLHTIDQFSAGLTDHDRIRASMMTMNEAEIQARIFGLPATSSEMAIFDGGVLSMMTKEDVKQPSRGILYVRRGKDDQDKTDEEMLAMANERTRIRFEQQDDGNLRVWTPPHPLGQYVIGCDVAHGLTRRDASVASVLRMKPMGFDIYFNMAAQYHAWIDPILYAEELFKLGLLYAPATLVIERNGPGEVVIKRLKDLGCWFMYHDTAALGSVMESLDSLYGVDTNVRTKSVIVSMLQSTMKLRRVGKPSLVLPCTDTIKELRAYIQSPTESGKSFRFEASGTGEDGLPMHDDRVMSLALAIYAAKTSPIYDFDLEKHLRAAVRGKAQDETTRKFWERFRREEEEKRQRMQELAAEYEAEEGTWE